MPRTHGDGFLHVRRIDAMVWNDAPLPEVDYSTKTSDAIKQIGKNVASLIEDGATLQMGIGSIPDPGIAEFGRPPAPGHSYRNAVRRVIPLIEKGIIDNSRKKLNVGRSVTGFMLGTKKLYDFVNDNPQVRVMDIAYVNDTSVIRQKPQGHRH